MGTGTGNKICFQLQLVRNTSGICNPFPLLLTSPVGKGLCDRDLLAAGKGEAGGGGEAEGGGQMAGEKHGLLTMPQTGAQRGAPKET
jgi:hypothetical protein